MSSTHGYKTATLQMRDPLLTFDWSNLYKRYDDQCTKSGNFNPSSPHLSAFNKQPTSDRELYYTLISSVASELQAKTGISLSTYEGMLYWKLYSQKTPFACGGVLQKLGTDLGVRNQVQAKLQRLSLRLPNTVPLQVDGVLKMVESLNEYEVLGMASSDSLPVRTTFLHFLYPDAVPIFDKQVLQAVGIDQRNANHSKPILRQYLPHAWELSTIYATNCSSFQRESRIRVIDMALWVIRGTQNS